MNCSRGEVQDCARYGVGQRRVQTDVLPDGHGAGYIYFEALPPELLQKCMDELVAARGLPSRNVKGMAWGIREVIPPGHATRLLEWESRARSKVLNVAL